jgi:hypothetical protein
MESSEEYRKQVRKKLDELLDEEFGEGVSSSELVSCQIICLDDDWIIRNIGRVALDRYANLVAQLCKHLFTGVPTVEARDAVINLVKDTFDGVIIFDQDSSKDKL